jgi:hypothetical protein
MIDPLLPLLLQFIPPNRGGAPSAHTP